MATTMVSPEQQPPQVQQPAAPQQPPAPPPLTVDTAKDSIRKALDEDPDVPAAYAAQKSMVDFLRSPQGGNWSHDEVKNFFNSAAASAAVQAKGKEVLARNNESPIHAGARTIANFLTSAIPFLGAGKIAPAVAGAAGAYLKRDNPDILSQENMSDLATGVLSRVPTNAANAGGIGAALSGALHGAGVGYGAGKFGGLFSKPGEETAPVRSGVMGGILGGLGAALPAMIRGSGTAQSAKIAGGLQQATGLGPAETGSAARVAQGKGLDVESIARLQEVQQLQKEAEAANKARMANPLASGQAPLPPSPSSVKSPPRVDPATQMTPLEAANARLTGVTPPGKMSVQDATEKQIRDMMETERGIGSVFAKTPTIQQQQEADKLIANAGSAQAKLMGASRQTAGLDKIMGGDAATGPGHQVYVAQKVDNLFKGGQGQASADKAANDIEGYMKVAGQKGRVLVQQTVMNQILTKLGDPKLPFNAYKHVFNAETNLDSIFDHPGTSDALRKFALASDKIRTATGLDPQVIIRSTMGGMLGGAMHLANPANMVERLMQSNKVLPGGKTLPDWLTELAENKANRSPAAINGLIQNTLYLLKKEQEK